MFNEQISINITTNGYQVTDNYVLTSIIPPNRNARFANHYGYFKVLNAKNKGLVFKVLNSNTSSIIDFKVCDVYSMDNLDTGNVKFFMQGEYHRYEGKFKNVKTGAEFNEKLMDFSFDTALAKKIIEFIWTLFNSRI